VRTNNRDARQVQFEAWLDGYFTAYNTWVVKAPQADVLKTDQAGRRAFLDKYCRENPTDLFVSAVATLLRDQMAR